MSLTVTEVLTSAVSAATIKTAAALVREYTPGVLEDIKDAAVHAIPGKPYRVPISPVKVLIRDARDSHIRADISGPGCLRSNVVRGLFRKHCPEGMQVSFDHEPTMAYIDGDQVRVTRLIVCFMIPSEHTRAPRKRR